MRMARLSGETGPVHDACGAVQASVSLEPGEDRVVYILLGCGDSRESAARLARKYGEARRLRAGVAETCARSGKT